MNNLLILVYDELPPDHYTVFKAVTRYSWVDRDAVLRAFGITKKHLKDWRQPICTPLEFRTRVRKGDGHNGLIQCKTDGKGVPVVYDSVGKDTFMGSLDCLSTRGLLANFGSASGPPEPLNVGLLAPRGSLYVTRPTLMTYCAERDELERSASRLFDMVGSGKVKIEVNQTYPLAEAGQAHRDLEARKTTGSTVFTV